MSNELIKPKINKSQAEALLLDLYGLKVRKISELEGYDDKNFHVVVDENPFNNEILSDGYVLKIVNTLDSQDRDKFQAQTELMNFLNQHNIRCQKTVPSLKQKSFEIVTLESGRHIVRLLEFIPGSTLFKVENPSANLLFAVGVLAAKIDNALQTFDHPTYHKRIQWCLGSAPEILDCIQVIKEEKQTLIRNIINEFSSRVLSIEEQLDKGQIHGDINEQNVVVQTNNSETSIKAIIDFGDSHYCCYLYELALAMTYMIFSSDNIDSGGYVLAGYSSIRAVKEEEIGLLKICVMARFSQSLVMGAYASSQEPDNKYLLTTSKKGWELLRKLSVESDVATLARWKKIVQETRNTEKNCE